MHGIVPSATTGRRPVERRRVLIVNVFLDEYRRTRGSPHRVPRAMGPPYLAGAFARDLWEIELYNEQYSGLLADARLLGWPDLLVLTGLTSSFDRMMQLTAYARTLNENVIVAAGGPAIRALPLRAEAIFDYACLGDIEQLQDVIRDAFGPDYASETMFPRFDLAYGGGMFGYVETSRNCNFNCSFCSLTGEKGTYRSYDLGLIRDQIEAAGAKQICFIDNNFYGNNRDHFLAKVDLCREFYEAGRIKGWSCLVTGDFFARSENLEVVRRAGCKAIFSGIESFDRATLAAYNKRHNSVVPQLDMIRGCLDAGILFAYGVMLDPSSRRLDDLRAEIEFILNTPDITLPAYFTLAIPLIGTPYFRDCLDRSQILPDSLLRNLDGVTLTMRPLDPIDEVLGFVRDLPSLHGYRRLVARHAAAFLRRYRSNLDPLQLLASAVTAALIGTEFFASSPSRIERRRVRQTYFGPTEVLDRCYTPMFRLPSRYEPYFQPTRVTTSSGDLHPDVAGDVLRAAGA